MSWTQFHFAEYDQCVVETCWTTSIRKSEVRWPSAVQRRCFVLSAYASSMLQNPAAGSYVVSYNVFEGIITLHTKGLDNTDLKAYLGEKGSSILGLAKSLRVHSIRSQIPEHRAPWIMGMALAC